MLSEILWFFITQDHPVKPSERNDGTYEGVKLFHPSNLERTILCPKASVLPLAILDQPGSLDQPGILDQRSIGGEFYLSFINSQSIALHYLIGVPAQISVNFTIFTWLVIKIKLHLFIEYIYFISILNIFRWGRKFIIFIKTFSTCLSLSEIDAIFEGEENFVQTIVSGNWLSYFIHIYVIIIFTPKNRWWPQRDPFNFTVGSQFFIDTEHEGFKYGHVIWHGKPDLYMEEHVGIELVRTDLYVILFPVRFIIAIEE